MGGRGFGCFDRGAVQGPATDWAIVVRGSQFRAIAVERLDAAGDDAQSELYVGNCRSLRFHSSPHCGYKVGVIVVTCGNCRPDGQSFSHVRELSAELVNFCGPGLLLCLPSNRLGGMGLAAFGCLTRVSARCGCCEGWSSRDRYSRSVTVTAKTPEEAEEFEDGGDPCVHVLRLWPDGPPATD